MGGWVRVMLAATVLALGLGACGGGSDNAAGQASSAATGDAARSASSSSSSSSSSGGTRGQDSGGSTGSSTASAPTPTDTAGAGTSDKAMALWHNTDLAKHPKGSCAGCHGADFFDLASIGSTSTDIRRRALIDGASSDEADALVEAVLKLRGDFKLPSRDARGFRPLQPGGSVLLETLDDTQPLTPILRDLEFGKRLSALLPTLTSAQPIRTLEQARRANQELLDLARGTNQAGANPKGLDLRSLPVGIVYPLWSADLHHGSREGTFNDWLADVAHDARPEQAKAWRALQDRWLAEPSSRNFWSMYAAVDEMTAVPLLGPCAGDTAALRCGATDEFNRSKFLTALIGQHLLRRQALGDMGDFLSGGALAFSYLDKQAAFADYRARTDRLDLLPNSLWEVGDRGRVVLESTKATGSLRDNLIDLGYPVFVQDSIDPQRSAGQEQHALRLPWFWIGFTFDPSLGRVSDSNATKVGEYMVGSLLSDRMFLHNAFSQAMRLSVKGFVPEANPVVDRKKREVTYATPVFELTYRYFWGYGRTVIDKEWRDGEYKAPDSVKQELQARFGTLVGNMFRMGLLLQLDEFDQGKVTDKVRQRLLADLGDSESQNGVRQGGLSAMLRHFEHYHAGSLQADRSLVDALAQTLGASYR